MTALFPRLVQQPLVQARLIIQQGYMLASVENVYWKKVQQADKALATGKLAQSEK